MRHFLMAFGICLTFAMSPCAKSGSEGKVSDKANAKIKICLAGDSTVQTYKPEDAITGWGQVLNQFFKEEAFIENHAIGGRSTKTFTTEGRWKKLLEAKPDYILIQFGHNDAHQKEKPESTDANTDYKEYLVKFVDEAKAAGATPILVTPMHRRIFEKDGTPSKELLPYATAMKEVATDKKIICIDLYELSGSLLKDIGDAGSAELFCSPTDKSHFSQKGAEKMASLIVDDLKRQNILTTYIRQVPLKTPAKIASPKLQVATKGSVHLYGKNANVSMSFDSGSEGVSGGYAEWMKDEKEKRVIVSVPSGAEWTKSSFSFTPKTSGKILLILMCEGKDAFICYDDIGAGGATIINGDFERINQKGFPEGWDELKSPLTITADQGAHSGKTFVKCSSDNRLNQLLQVEAGKQVTITLWIKADK